MGPTVNNPMPSARLTNEVKTESCSAHIKEYQVMTERDEVSHLTTARCAIRYAQPNPHHGLYERVIGWKVEVPNDDTSGF